MNPRLTVVDAQGIYHGHLFSRLRFGRSHSPTGEMVLRFSKLSGQ